MASMAVLEGAPTAAGQWARTGAALASPRIPREAPRPQRGEWAQRGSPPVKGTHNSCVRPLSTGITCNLGVLIRLVELGTGDPEVFPQVDCWLHTFELFSPFLFPVSRRSCSHERQWQRFKHHSSYAHFSALFGLRDACERRASGPRSFWAVLRPRSPDSSRV